MVQEPTPSPPAAQPNVLIPKTIGILNIVFGLFLMGCGTCYAFYVPGLASLGPILKARQAEVQARQDAAQKAEIEALKKQEQAAETEEEKASIRAQRAAVESRPKPPVLDIGFGNFGFDNRLVFASFALDAASGLLLNLVLFVSGFGLLARKEWARKLAVGVAGVKFGRLVLLTAIMLFLAVPIVIRSASTFFHDQAVKATAEADAQKQPSPLTVESAAEIVNATRLMLNSYFVALFVLGSIYPLLVFFLLRTAGARAACAPKRYQRDWSQ